MERATGITRRALLTSVGLGILAGGTWGAAIQALATPSAPSLSVVGKEDMQIVLLDTTEVRVLLLLGSPDDDLQSQIPGMLTMLRQRVDLLVGASSSVNALGSSFRNRWQLVHTLAIAEPASPPVASETLTTVRDDLMIDVGNGVSLDLRIAVRGAWKQTVNSHTLWAAIIRYGEHKIVLAPSGEALVELGATSPSLALVPVSPLGDIANTIGPGAIATNSRDDLTLQVQEPLGTVLVRIYAQDTARFELSRSGLTLPAWHERI
ncbi:MAG TPA: hypothetical protein VGR29_12715 [Thermomicrobiales bacterium]|nr:hypothetical protein [Thermomicrobiales bacterium]